MTQAEQIRDLREELKFLQTRINKIESIADQGLGALKIVMWVGGLVIGIVSVGSAIWERIHGG